MEYLNRGVLPEGFRARPTELIVGIEPDVLLLREADTPAYKRPPSQPLPSLPLFLRTDQLWVSVDLDKSYEETLEAGRYEPV